MNTLKVSIITVCFNSAATIERTIKSVVRQSYRNIEYIIIDGNSTDGTLDIVKRYERYISDWISEPDQGLYEAMNKGIGRASGELIGIINSDDWYECDAVKKVVDCYEGCGAGVIHGDLGVVFDGIENSYRVAPGGCADDLYFHMIYNHPTVFVKSELYKKHGLFNCSYRLAADYDFLMRLHSAGEVFHYVPSIIANFQMGGLSSGKKVWRVALEERRIAERNLENLPPPDRKKYGKLIAENYKAAKHKAANQFIERRTHGEIGTICLKRMIEGKRAFVIFGAGILGVSYFQWLRDKGVPVEYFVDNSPLKQERQIGGARVCDPGRLRQDQREVMVLIAITYSQDAVEKQLKGMGLRRDIDFIAISGLYRRMAGTYLLGKCGNRKI